MAAQQRPLSPHLSVYKLPMAARLSILHRATGCFLAVAAFGLALWLVAAAGSIDDFERMRECLRTWPAQLLMAAALFCFFLHLCSGIRHLFWDIGWGLELKSVSASNWGIVLLSLLGTIAYAWLAWNAGGAA
jgi:succinate dehydrogenase / fumarate reductase cytochrome b subunit